MSLASAPLIPHRQVNRMLAGRSADLPRSKNRNETKLKRHAAVLDRITHDVKNNWSGMDASLRDFLTAFVYVEPEQVPALRGFASKLSWAWAFLTDSEGFLEFMAASSRLYEAVLFAIEEHNAEFQEALTVALDDLNLDELVGAPLEAGREHEFLAGI